MQFCQKTCAVRSVCAYACAFVCCHAKRMFVMSRFVEFGTRIVSSVQSFHSICTSHIRDMYVRTCCAYVCVCMWVLVCFESACKFGSAFPRPCIICAQLSSAWWRLCSPTSMLHPSSSRTQLLVCVLCV